MIALLADYLSVTEYLEWEQEQEEKHEYVNGSIYAMAGASEDRGVKFANYQTMESLQEYVLISQSEPRIEVFRRTEHKLWLLQVYTEGESLELQSINLTIPISSIYEGIDLLESIAESNMESNTEKSTGLN